MARSLVAALISTALVGPVLAKDAPHAASVSAASASAAPAFEAQNAALEKNTEEKASGHKHPATLIRRPD